MDNNNVLLAKKLAKLAHNLVKAELVNGEDLPDGWARREDLEEGDLEKIDSMLHDLCDEIDRKNLSKKPSLPSELGSLNMDNTLKMIARVVWDYQSLLDELENDVSLAVSLNAALINNGVSSKRG